MNSSEWSLIGEILRLQPDLKKVERLLNSREVNPRGKDELGFPFLVLAATCRQIGVAKLLIPYVDVNMQEEQLGRTALMYAAMDGDIEFIKLLKKHGADVNIKDHHGRTAIDYAGKQEIIDALLQDEKESDEPEL